MQTGLTQEREARLLAALRGKSRDSAQQALLTELMKPLHALCLHVLGNRADADDALQEALVAVYRGLPAFRGESRLTTWAYRITVRIATRRARRRVRHGALDHEIAPSTSGCAETNLLAKQALAALDELPAKHRVVLALFAIDGLTHGEIAEILDVPEGTVWSRLHHARQKVRERVGGKS